MCARKTLWMGSALKELAARTTDLFKADEAGTLELAQKLAAFSVDPEVEVPDDFWKLVPQDLRKPALAILAGLMVGSIGGR